MEFPDGHDRLQSVETKFSLTKEFCYDGDHEQLEHSTTISLEFVHALRSTGIVRDYAYHDTYNGHGAFSAAASEGLLQRTAMRNHPAFIKDPSYLTMTDKQRKERG
jgi:hypothetical protein